MLWIHGWHSGLAHGLSGDIKIQHRESGNQKPKARGVSQLLAHSARSRGDSLYVLHALQTLLCKTTATRHLERSNKPSSLVMMMLRDLREGKPIKERVSIGVYS